MNHRHNRRRRASTNRAFTLVELLVVIGIIGVLMAVLLPMVARSMRQGKRVAQAQTLQTISTALQAYQGDYGRFPQVLLSNTGATTLYNAVGKDRPGKLDQDIDGNGVPEASSVSLPPYMKSDSVKADSGNNFFIDVWGEKAILYYPANPVTNVSIANRYAYAWGYAVAAATPAPRWNTSDNLNAISTERFQKMTGDLNSDTLIGAGETAIDVPFVLWSAGPDGVYTPVGGIAKEDIEKCDDVTNFK